VSRRAIRGTIALPALAVLGVLLFWGLSGLPPFGHYEGLYGKQVNSRALPERHATNAVTATVFDYRGFDTLGEEFILFAAVTGVVLLLRTTDGEHEEAPRDRVQSDAIRVFGLVGIGAVVLIGLWLAAYGYITPGGGFQGGVAIAAGLVLVYLTIGFRPWRRLSQEHVLDPIEGTGAGGFVVVGLAALVSGLPFLTNLLGPGTPGTLLSGGSIAFVNWAAALEVAAANTILFKEFVEEYIVPLARERA
jgi:multicomponent Na+:H+ antiporter subunit B